MESNIKRIEEQLIKLLEKVDTIKSGRQKSNLQPKFYRNKDLRKLFGLSSNTIIKYRDNGTLPYTFMGDIYLYPASEIKKLLINNSTYNQVDQKRGGSDA